jgi:hypothetical protein
MNLKTKLMGLGLVAMASAGILGAQETGWQAGGALSYASGMDLKRHFTNQDIGFILEGGYVGKLAASTVPFRTNLSFNFFPGKTTNGSKIDLNGMQLAGDLFISTPMEKLRIITGLSLNKWSMKVTTPAENYTNSVKGLKFGGRIGFDYAFSKHVTGEVIFQAVELGSDMDYQKTPDYPNGTYGINPSWLQFGVKYHF